MVSRLRESTIECLGRDNVFRKYEVTHIFNDEDDSYIFYASPKGGSINSPFEMHLELIGKEGYWLKYMEHPRTEEFYARGIPEEVILYASKLIGYPITSTRTHSEDSNYWRSESASKVWQRLVAMGKATYIVDMDVYRTTT